MTEKELLDRINRDEIRFDPATMQLRVWHKSYRRFILKTPDPHPVSGRMRYQFGEKRKKIYRNRLVWIYTHRRLPNGFIDHIDTNRLNDSPDNLQEHTPEESCRQGNEIQTQLAYNEVADYFDTIAQESAC